MTGQLMKKLIRRMMARGKPPLPDKMEKILFVKLFAIGDCLNATPALRELRKHLPGSRIDVMVGRWSTPVFAGNPYSDTVRVIEDDWFRTPDPRALIRLMREIRRERYDCLLLFHRDPKLGAFFAFTGIPVRIGLDLEGDGYWLTDPVVESGVDHEIRIYNSLLSPLGIHADNTRMELFPSEADLDAAEKLWAAARFDPELPVVGITPGGASNPGERMPQRIYPHYSELVRRMMAAGYQIAYFGGKGDAYALDQLPRSPTVHSFIGDCGLVTSGLLMARCAVVITHDSGPMHLAAAAGAKTLSLWAPTDPLRKAPRGSGHKWLKADIPCAPCYHRGKWNEKCTQECIGSIPVERVLKEAVLMLSNRD